MADLEFNVYLRIYLLAQYRSTIYIQNSSSIKFRIEYVRSRRRRKRRIYRCRRLPEIEVEMALLTEALFSLMRVSLSSYLP